MAAGACWGRRRESAEKKATPVRRGSRIKRWRKKLYTRKRGELEESKKRFFYDRADAAHQGGFLTGELDRQRGEGGKGKSEAVERIGAGNNSWRLGPWGHSWRRAAVLCGTSVLLGNLLSARSIWAPHSAQVELPQTDPCGLLDPIPANPRGTKRVDKTDKMDTPGSERRVKSIDQSAV